MTEADARLFSLVLVGVDGSDGANGALLWAAAFAKATDAEVLAAYVLTYSREFLRDLSPDTMRAWRLELEGDLGGAWTRPLRDTGVRHRSVVVEADTPAAGLIELADHEGVDLLVVGSKGQGNLAGRVLGGVSYRIAHHASQPVVVVPASWSPLATGK